ncbi:MAG: ATP-binding protein [Armatimonadota bacterium]
MQRRDVVGDRSASEDGFSLTLPARPASVPIVRQAVRQFATMLRCDSQQTFELQVAIGEAVTNAVVHAYPEATGMVWVKVWRTGRTLHAEIEDHGKWTAGPPKGLGLGLRVIKTFAGDARIKGTASGTTVRLSFSLGPKTDSTGGGQLGSEAA